MNTTVKGTDGKLRCSWCSATPDYIHYHDNEWGFPVDDDTRLFEKLCLEGFQSGLSWRTILAKRDNFRAAFANFVSEAPTTPLTPHHSQFPTVFSAFYDYCRRCKSLK